MTIFASDSFTDADNVLITTHDPKWVRSGVGISASGTPKISSNRLVPGFASFGEWDVYRYDQAPPSADYTSSAIVRGSANAQRTGVGVRISAGTANDATSFGYFMGYKIIGGADLGIRKWNGDSSVVVVIDDFGSAPLVTDIDYLFELEVSGSSTTLLEGYIQRVSDSQWLTASNTWQSTRVACLSGTDSSSPYTAAGFAGVSLYNAGGTTSQLDSFSASIPGTAATAITLSGPSGGTVGVASTNFTVGANGDITGTITVTPSDSGAGGTFTPTSVNISSGTPTATFTYTPASTGVKVISTSDNGSLTDPTPINYTSSSSAATAITLSGPSSGTVGVASTNFTVGANGTITGTITVTPSAGGGGGTFSPTSVNISAGSPTATFTYTAASAGVKSISTSDTGGLTDPTPISYTASAAPATAITLSGPSSGPIGVTSSDFTVGANGVISGTITVTPSAGGGGGTFAPTSVNISAGSPTATFTYTPASSGVKTISTSDNGGLTDPTPLSYTVSSNGTITDEVKNNTGTLIVSATIPKVAYLRVSDMVNVLTLSNQPTNSLGVMTVTNAALITGIAYIRVLSDATGANVGAQTYTAS